MPPYPAKRTSRHRLGDCICRTRTSRTESPGQPPQAGRFRQSLQIRDSVPAGVQAAHRQSRLLQTNANPIHRCPRPSHRLAFRLHPLQGQVHPDIVSPRARTGEQFSFNNTSLMLSSVSVGFDSFPWFNRGSLYFSSSGYCSAL